MFKTAPPPLVLVLSLPAHSVGVHSPPPSALTGHNVSIAFLFQFRNGGRITCTKPVENSPPSSKNSYHRLLIAGGILWGILCVVFCIIFLPSFFKRHSAQPPAQPVNIPPAAAPARVETGPRSPQRFWFDYGFQPSPGKRFWSAAGQVWTERYEDGHQSQFRVIGRATVKGATGILAAKFKGNIEQADPADEGTYQVFIPDLGSQPMQLWARARNNGGVWGNWSFLNEMRDVE